MSSHDVTDERFDELVRELRSTRPDASDELRRRVREIAARPLPARRSRTTWLLAPAAAAAVAGAIVIGVLSSGGESPSQRQAAPTVAGQALKEADAAVAGGSGSSAPIAPGGRAQLYAADITLRVRDLSASTQRALRVTRGLGGYIRVVDYGSGAKTGSADLVLRVPIARVQQAIVRFSGLGTILDQHVSVRDIQPSLDRRFARIAELQRTIPTLSGDALAAAEAELEALRTAQARERQRASFATVSLHLATKDTGAVLPAPPGRIERAFDRAVDVLVAELTALIYALVVAAPFILLAAALVAAARGLRRRSNRRLLGYP